VPTLRGLQSLERTHDDEGARAPAPRRWGARQGLLFLGTLLAVVSLVAAVGLEFFRPTQLMVVERLLPPTNPPGPVVRDWPEPMAVFKSLTPADVWLTWEITAPVGADRRATMIGHFADQNETHWVLAWQDWKYMVWVIGGFGVALIAVSLLIPAKSARRPIARNRAGTPT
jgi:hypothetical protein